MQVPVVQATPPGESAQSGRQTPPMQALPGWQSSSCVEQVAPDLLSCVLAQSQTVPSVSATPVRPARNTHLKPARGLAHSAVPVGLQVSAGGVHSHTLGTDSPVMSTGPIAEQRLLPAQSPSLRHMRKHCHGHTLSEMQSDPGSQLFALLVQVPCTGTKLEGGGAVSQWKLARVLASMVHRRSHAQPA